jgi:signal transduction histidine kinase
MSAIAQLHLRAEEPADRLQTQTEQQLRKAPQDGGDRPPRRRRRPLTGMVLCSELILAGLEENHRLRRFTEEIRKAGEQGAELIQQLMAVTRQRAIEPRLLCPHDVICEVRSLLTRARTSNWCPS